MYDNNTYEPNDILTLEEASQLFQVSSKTFLKLLREESIPARKIGREWRFSRNALMAWIAAGNSREYTVAEDVTKAYFEQMAPVYDEMRKDCYNKALRDLMLARFPLESDWEVADIGCGTGYLTKGLAGQVKTVWAIDASPAMLKVAEADLTQAGLTNVHFVEGDAHDLPLEDASQNVVFANLLLHHLLEPALAVNEMHRVLRPGGCAIITDIVAHPHQWVKLEKSDIWQGFERSAIKKWLQDAGFEKIEITELGCNCRTSSITGKPAEIPMFLALGYRQQAKTS